MIMKSTISLIGPLHIYREVTTGQICMGVTESFDPSRRELNENSDDWILSLEELTSIRDEISDYLRQFGSEKEALRSRRS